MTQLPAFGGAFHHALGDLADAIGVRHLQPRSVQAAFVAAAHEGLEEPVVQGILFLFVLLDHAAIAFHPAGDFVGQQLVPELPAQALGDPLGDLGAAAAVFAFDGDDSDHGCFSPEPNWYYINARYYSRSRLRPRK